MSASAISIKRVTHWIGGKAAESKSGKSGAVWNPATGEQEASVDFASCSLARIPTRSSNAA